MSLSPMRVLRAARALWSRDRAILAPLSGLFLFLPQWAVMLLVPDVPPVPAEADQPSAVAAWGNAFSAWAEAHAGTYIVSALLTQFGVLAVTCLYLGKGAGRADSAMGRALALFGRFLLANLIVWIPLALGLSVLLAVGGTGLVMGVLPLLYMLVVALLMLVTPAVAAGSASAIGSVGRAWRTARGQRASLVALAAGVVITEQLAAGALMAVMRALRGAGAENPVVVALLSAGAASALWAGSLALALSGVVAYRALAR